MERMSLQVLPGFSARTDKMLSRDRSMAMNDSGDIKSGPGGPKRQTTHRRLGGNTPTDGWTRMYKKAVRQGIPIEDLIGVLTSSQVLA